VYDVKHDLLLWGKMRWINDLWKCTGMEDMRFEAFTVVVTKVRFPGSDSVLFGRSLPTFHRILLQQSENGGRKFFRNICDSIPDYTLHRT
jgi:hypothetical protein